MNLKIRLFVRKIFLNTVGRDRKISPGVHILNGHYISKNNNVNSDVFFNLVNELRKEVDFIDLKTACDYIDKKQRMNYKLIAFSFDDGFEDCYTKVAPVLDYFNIKGAFFINPNFHINNVTYVNAFLNEKVSNPFKKPMSIEMIKTLTNNGHLIGGHTMDHERLNIKDYEELKYQILNCKKDIESITNNVCDMFAWPYGKMSDINSEAYKLMKENYRYIFSSCNNNYYKTGNYIYNRRHFEGEWPINHLNYFLSFNKQEKTALPICLAE